MPSSTLAEPPNALPRVMETSEFAGLAAGATVRGIDQVEQELSALGFLRVRRCYLVNVRHIHDVTAVRDRLVLATGTTTHDRVPVSRRYVSAVRRALNI